MATDTASAEHVLRQALPRRLARVAAWLGGIVAVLGVSSCSASR